MADLYAEAGVNVTAGDVFSKRAADLTVTTHGNTRFARVIDYSRGNFRGPKAIDYLPGFPQEIAPDGAGTKPSTFYDTVKLHRYAARDVLAMTAGDVTRYGGLPVVFTNTLNAKRLGEVDSEPFTLLLSAVEELVAACNEQGYIAYKGETAEMNVCVTSPNPNPTAPFNWDGVMIGLTHKDKVIYGDRVKPGDKVIALQEYGFRANGISLARKGFEEKYGNHFYGVPEAQDDIAAACAPSVLYDKMLATANGWHNMSLRRLFDVRLIAHMTGGGIKKFSELLALNGLSARLDNLFDLPLIMTKCAEWCGIDSEELYKVWNGGQGVILVVPPQEAEDFILFADDFGIKAQVCGEITPTPASSKTTVEVTSRYDGEKLLFS